MAETKKSKVAATQTFIAYTRGGFTEVDHHDVSGLPQKFIPFRCVDVSLFAPEEPVLTVPDMEDSIERMLSRRIAGIQEKHRTTDGSVNYPVDPTSLTTANKVVSLYQAEMQAKLETQKKAILESAEQKAREKEAKKQEKQQYEEFKAAQAKLKESK